MKATLSERHLRALRWFSENAGQETGWPAPLEDGTLLATKAKGIYKPRWTHYALSVRHSLRGPYPDRDLVIAEASWTYRYFQENLDISSLRAEYTNRGLLACIEDEIPVGVLVQGIAQPPGRYQVMGLADVLAWDQGYFTLRGRNENR